MEPSHSYSIALKKNGIFVSLHADDVYFISRQMDKWCEDFLQDGYTPISSRKKTVPPEEAPDKVLDKALVNLEPSGASEPEVKQNRSSANECEYESVEPTQHKSQEAQEIQETAPKDKVFEPDLIETTQTPPPETQAPETLTVMPLQLEEPAAVSLPQPEIGTSHSEDSKPDDNPGNHPEVKKAVEPANTPQSTPDPTHAQSETSASPLPISKSPTSELPVSESERSEPERSEPDRTAPETFQADSSEPNDSPQGSDQTKGTVAPQDYPGQDPAQTETQAKDSVEANETTPDLQTETPENLLPQELVEHPRQDEEFSSKEHAEKPANLDTLSTESTPSDSVYSDPVKPETMAAVDLPIQPKASPDQPTEVPTSGRLAGAQSESVTAGASVALLDDDGIADDFEAIMDSVMKDLDAPDVPDLMFDPDSAAEDDHMGNSAADRAQQKNDPLDDVDALLINNMDNLGDLGTVHSLADLCEKANPDSPRDYLILAAYYLSIIEHQATFSLNQINKALASAGLSSVNHSTLETVLSAGDFSMVPDLTGMAEVAEYLLTPEGQQSAQLLFQ
ncbi:MAG: hypothetical protein AAGI66_03590 [Cyanobacteria bacterium P01_H01_bin.74]